MTTFAEQLGLSYIACGLVELDSEGCFWRIAKKSGNGHIVPCLCHRAEHRRPNGYLDIPVWFENHSYYPLTHRVLWAYLHDGEIDESLEVNHIDLDKTNNRLDNLELVSHRANRRHAAMHKRYPNCKLKPLDVLEVRRLLASNTPICTIARSYSVTPRAIACIRDGSSYAWLDSKDYMRTVV